MEKNKKKKEKETLSLKKETSGLENIVFSKIQPAIDAIMHKFMGVKIEEIGSDISEKLGLNPLIGYEVDSFLPFREAKLRFRREYFERLLVQKYGNISEVARIAGIERRSIHRFINEVRLDVNHIREEMIKPEYVRELAVQKTVREVMHGYERLLHPEKMKKIYADIPIISRDIARELPSDPMPLKAAEEEFTRQYFKVLLGQKMNITQISKHAGLRYESVHRKLRALGLI